MLSAYVKLPQIIPIEIRNDDFLSNSKVSNILIALDKTDCKHNFAEDELKKSCDDVVQYSKHTILFIQRNVDMLESDEVITESQIITMNNEMKAYLKYCNHEYNQINIFMDKLCSLFDV